LKAHQERAIMTQQTPYIGSKISLISKLDIRYEGILYTVDKNESTIALAKVRSFGTEDRPTVNPVPARNDVYDYIIFKASDIKDLIVCDTPKPVAQLSSGLPYDPAILTVSSQSHVLPPQSNDAVSNVNLISAGSSRSETPTQITVGVDEGQEGALSQVSSRAPGSGRAVRSNSVTDEALHAQHAFHHQKIRQPTGAPLAARAPLTMGTRPPGLVPIMQQNYRNMGPQPAGFGQRQIYRGGQRGAGNYYQRGYVGGCFSRGQRGGAMGKTQTPKERFKYDTDYDFEKANEQFQETLNHLAKDLKKTKLEEGGSEKGSNASDAGADVVDEGEVNESCEENKIPTTYYDKSSSFFDRISCEALEKQEGKQPRTDWRKERETNQQTFGHLAVRSLAYRRGRGYQAGRNMRGGNNLYRCNNNFNYNGQRAGFGFYQNGYHRRGGHRNHTINE
uniref:LSM14 domain-containing protein n=1 Tax=Anisakis simplex TaxID=6269 RepID=A0A0M3JTL0_ANISI